MENRITVEEAARLMHVSAQFVRLGIRRGTLPIGAAVKKSSVWTYYISPLLFTNFTGIQVPRKEGRGDE